MAQQNPQHISAPQRLAPEPARELVITYGLLTLLLLYLGAPILSTWLSDPRTRIGSFRYYSPLIEIAILLFAICAVGLRRSKRWAWWLALLCTLLFCVPGVSFRVLVRGIEFGPGDWFAGVFVLPLEELPFVRGAPLIYLLNLLAVVLLFKGSVRRHFGVDHPLLNAALGWFTLARVDAILVRVLAVAQVLACVFLFLFPYGFGMQPVMLFYEAFGVLSAALLFRRSAPGRILSLAWYAVALVQIAVQIATRPHLRPLDPSVSGVILFCTVVIAYLGFTWLAFRKQPKS